MTDDDGHTWSAEELEAFGKVDRACISHRERRRPQREEQPRHDSQAHLATELDWSGWERWLRERLDEERKFMLEVVAQALGEALGKARQNSRNELADEVRRLRLELCEAQTTLAELRQILTAERGKLPRLRAV